MPDLWMDVDAALSEVPVNILPLVDDTDFKSREIAVAFNAAGMDLVWNFVTTGGAFTQTAVTPTSGGDYDWAHQGDGMYTIEIPAAAGISANNDTEGFGWFTGICDGVLPWRGPVIGFRATALNNLLVDSAYSATRGLSGTALPDAAAGAVGGLPVEDANGNIPADLARWKGTAPADLSANGYTQAMVLRWLTDNAAGTPQALDAGKRLSVNLQAILTTVLVESLEGRLANNLSGFLDVGTRNLTVGSYDQTGDAFARLGVAGAGLTALGDARLANLDATMSSRSTYAGGAVASVTGDVAGKVLGGGASTITGTGARVVDGSGNAVATSANQDTILGRLGAWTGTGVNTVLGAFKALLSKVASAPSDIGGTFAPASDSTEAISEAVAALDVGSGTGARTVVLTVTGTGGAALQNATVRYTLNGETKATSTTNVSGQVTLALDDGTYTEAVTCAGYTGESTSRTVDGTEAFSAALTAITPSEPASVDLCTVYGSLYLNGTAVEGATVTATLTDDDPVDGTVLLRYTAATDATDSNGYWELELVRGKQYRISVPNHRTVTTTIPEAATLDFSTI